MFEWHEHTSLEKEMNVNFLAGVNVLRAFLPLVKKAQGRIIGNHLL